MTWISATLTAGPVRQHLMQLTGPMVLGILAMMAFNIVDTWFVAQLGELELAAMSFTFPVIMTLISLGIGLMAGTSSVLARSIGAGDWERVRRLTTDATLLALLLSVLCTIVGLLTLKPLFRLLGATEEVLPLIEDYMVIWYGGFVVVLVPMVGLGAVRATGDSKLQARVMGAAALFNVVLDPLLIFGLAGFPRLELEGAAWATIISRALTLLVGYWALQFKKGMLTYSVVRGSVVWDSWKRVLQVGLPAAGTNIIVPIGAGVVTAMIARYGPIAVAGFGAATRIEQLTLVVFYALSVRHWVVRI
jgi:putative MATE family efflux protein